MEISVITLFPQIFETLFNSSILKKAQDKGLVKYNLIDLRQFGQGKHQVVDGKLFGGGTGMLLRVDVLAKAVKQALGTRRKVEGKTKVVLTSPAGVLFNQVKAQKLAKLDRLIIVCGHYEGVDQRFTQKYADEEISVGDFILTGGEIPAMLILDSVTRLVSGVLKPEATTQESFSGSGLEYDQYTRPAEFKKMRVPDVLLSGDHAEIATWRRKNAAQKTKLKRSDLL